MTINTSVSLLEHYQHTALAAVAGAQPIRGQDWPALTNQRPLSPRPGPEVITWAGDTGDRWSGPHNSPEYRSSNAGLDVCLLSVSFLCVSLTLDSVVLIAFIFCSQFH